MSVETGNTIVNFSSNWPLNGDPMLEGDDHIRLIKSILKSQFPGVGGQGFAKVIIASEDEINYLSGVTSNVQDQIDSLVGSLSAPQGTTLVFHQTVPPVGWTKITSTSGRIMRISSGTGGGTGGEDDPVNKSWSHSHTTGGHTLTIAQMPAHNHPGSTIAFTPDTSAEGGGSQLRIRTDRTSQVTVSSQGGGESHSHGDTGSSSSTFKPKYVDVIIASKD